MLALVSHSPYFIEAMKRWQRVKLSCGKMYGGQLIKVTGHLICTGGALLHLIHSFEKKGLIVDVDFEGEYRTREVRALGYDVRSRYHVIEPLKTESLAWGR